MERTWMGYWLGIDVGTTCTVAAICRAEPGRRALPEVIPLGNRSAAVSSALYLGQDGQVIVGEAAERCALSAADRVVREVIRRVSDQVPVVIGGVPLSAPKVAALVVRWVVDQVAQREGGSAVGMTITHPVGWTAETIQAMADALGGVDLPEVMFCPAPQAAAVNYAVRERLPAGATIAVYDLGGGSFDAAVVRKTGPATFSVLGVPEGIDRLGGADFDDAVFGYVVAAVPALRELAATDRVQRSVALCRRECTEAKEALSANTEVTIPVLLPEVQAQVQLVRAEFEDLIRPQVAQTVAALHRMLRSASVGPADLDAVLLVGGSSRVPLIAHLVSAELTRPVSVGADPQFAMALGAALSGLLADSAYWGDAIYPADADIASANVGPDPLYSPAPAMVGAGGFARADVAEPAPTQVPPQPSPTAIPWHLDPWQADVGGIEVAQRRAAARRLTPVAAAGALVVAGGVAAVLFLTSPSNPSTPTTARTPAPAAPVTTTPAPHPRSDGSLPSPEPTDPIPAGPDSAPQQPTGDTAAPAPADPGPAPHTTRENSSGRITHRSTPRASPTPPPPSPSCPPWVAGYEPDFC
jgi:molecular chaperone DnaK